MVGVTFSGESQYLHSHYDGIGNKAW